MQTSIAGVDIAGRRASISHATGLTSLTVCGTAAEILPIGRRRRSPAPSSVRGHDAPHVYLPASCATAGQIAANA